MKGWGRCRGLYFWVWIGSGREMVIDATVRSLVDGVPGKMRCVQVGDSARRELLSRLGKMGCFAALKRLHYAFDHRVNLMGSV